MAAAPMTVTPFRCSSAAETPKEMADVPLWGLPYMTSAKFSGFLTPSPLVRNLDCSIVLNPRNLPYYIFFWGTPSPLSVRTSYMDAPFSVRRFVQRKARGGGGGVPQATFHSRERDRNPSYSFCENLQRMVEILSLYDWSINMTQDDKHINANLWIY